MDIVELKIEGMSCQHCLDAVTKALQAVGRVDKVEVNLEAGTAKIWGPADKTELVAAVVKAGFSVS